MARMNRLFWVFGVIAATSVSLAAPVSQGPAGGADQLARKLKASVSDGIVKLGELEPWQKKITEDEILPLYSRFIKDYRLAAGQENNPQALLSVEVDFDSLKNYLRFHSTKAGLVSSDPTLLLLLRQEGVQCGRKCQESIVPFKRLMVARGLRRGFKPVWITSDHALSVDEGMEWMTKKKAVGLMQATLGVAAAEEGDTAHADELHYELSTSLLFQGLLGSESFSTQGRLEFLENDSYEMMFSKLMADGFTELGAKMIDWDRIRTSARASSVATRAGIEVTVRNFRDAATFSEAKAALQLKLPQSRLREKYLKPGEIILELKGSEKSEAVTQAIHEVLQMESFSTKGLSMEVRVP